MSKNIKKIIINRLKALLFIFVVCFSTIGFITLTSLDYVTTEATIVSIEQEKSHLRKGVHRIYYNVYYEYTYNNINYISKLKYENLVFDNRVVGLRENIKIDPHNPNRIKSTPLIDQYVRYGKFGLILICISTMVSIGRILIYKDVEEI